MRFFKIMHIEIADTVTADLALLFQQFKSLECVSQWVRAAPVQQITVEVIGSEPLQ